jgi:colanic acid biosynthesis glycosyl transferase WcaI
VRVIIHDYGGYNFSVQLGRELARRGTNVLYLYGETTQSVKRGKLYPIPEDPPNFEILGITLSKPFNKYALLVRRQQEIEYGKKLAATIERFQPEIVLSANSPLDAQQIALQVTHNIGARFVFWMQDAISLITYQTLNRISPIMARTVGKYYRWLEPNLLKKSDAIIPISINYLELIRQWDVNLDKVHMIPNWSPLDEIYPFPKNNQWSVANRFTGKFCFLYTGMLGYKHNPELLIDLAIHWKNNENVAVLVVSEGPGADWLTEQKSTRRIDNLYLKKFQPYKVFPLLLSAGDVAIAIQRPYISPFSIPSKILNYLCSGKPILAGFPANNPAVTLITESDSGLITSPVDNQAWLECSEKLYRDAELRQRFSENGLKYARNNFNIDLICDKFEKVIR